MDVTLLNSVSDTPIAEFLDRNTTTIDVQAPKFVLLYQPQAEQIRSFLSQSQFKGLDDLYHELETSTSSAVLREVSEAVNPTQNILKTSTLKYTPQYQDMKILDSSLLNLVPAKSSVLLFSSYAREFFVEKQCFINMILLGSAIEIVSNGTLKLSKGSATPQETFYLGAVKQQLVDNFVPLEFPPILEYLQADRQVLDNYFQVKQTGGSNNRKVQVIVHEEDSYNRTGVYYVKNSIYDTQFYEAALGGLSYLAQNGTMILKAVSLGSRTVADLLYFYKYVFASVSVVKTSTSQVLSQEHYIVAQGFREARFAEQKVTVYKFLDRMATLSQANPTPLWSFLNNLNPVANNTTPPNANMLEFTRWLIAANDRIAMWIIANAISTRKALEDRNRNFPEAMPLLILDQVNFRQAAGGVGRITNLLPVPGVLTGAIKDQHQDENISVENLTGTGQVQSDKIVLESVSTTLSRNFALYLALTAMIEELVNSPAFAPLLPQLASTTGDVKVSTEILFRAKQQLKYNLREWLGNLYSLGDIETIINLSNTPENNQKVIEDLLLSRRWSIQEMFNVSISQNSPLATVTPQQLSQFLAIAFSNLNQKFKAVLTGNKLQHIPVRIIPLQNLRFRVSFVNDGIDSALMNRQNPSVVGEYELLNCLTPTEMQQFDDVRKIIPLVATEKFQFRLAEHLCLPVLFSGFKNNLAVPDLYFEIQPDMEFFASAVNRYAPLWCSASLSDVDLGSQGDFFGPISEAGHPLYKDNQIKIAVAFPPFHPLIIEKTITRCLDLYQGLIDSDDKTAANETKDFAVVLIFQNASVYNDILAVNLAPRLIPTELLSERIITQVYDPFTGTTYQNANLKALAIRTPASTFSL